MDRPLNRSMCGRLRLRAFVSLGRLFFVKLVAAPERSVGMELLGLLKADCLRQSGHPFSPLALLF